jgi:hypothetical protein
LLLVASLDHNPFVRWLGENLYATNCTAAREQLLGGADRLLDFLAFSGDPDSTIERNRFF